MQAYEIVFTERDLLEKEEKNNKVLALLRRKSKNKVTKYKSLPGPLMPVHRKPAHLGPIEPSNF